MPRLLTSSAIFTSFLALGAACGGAADDPRDAGGTSNDAAAADGDCGCTSQTDASADEVGAVDAGGPRACHVNADCPPGHMCFIGASMACSSATGTCVGRLSSSCPQAAGAGCPCLDVNAGTCNGGAGTYCSGSDDPEACWHCHVPL